MKFEHRVNLGISVLKKYQRNHIGATLLQYGIANAKAKKCKVIELQVCVENKKAIDFYIKNGFTMIGRYNSYIKIKDCYFDVYLMNLYLN